MDITRHNYEEYFLLYVDHELNAAERKAVEHFVQQNPDLEEELIMLQQSVLRPDEKLVFARKENLLKNTAGQGLINENNYEDYFVLYGDDELTNEEKDLVEQFVYKYPQYQVEFELIQQAKLVPEAITFPDKAYLYRTEEDDHKVVPFAWWRMAAAAIVLITIGSLGLYIAMSDNISTNGATVAQTTDADKGNINQTLPAPDTKNVVIEKQDIKKTVEPAVTTNNDQKVQYVAASVKTNKKPGNSSNISKPANVPQTNDQQMVVYEPVQDISDPHLSAKPVAVAVASHTTVNPITAENISSKPVPVTTAIAAVMPDVQNDNKTYVLNTSVNKTPLRGFFRKVSRVVEKATNFEPDENKKGGVRIANLEIAFQ
jgi:hypothetical protein